MCESGSTISWWVHCEVSFCGLMLFCEQYMYLISSEFSFKCNRFNFPNDSTAVLLSISTSSGRSLWTQNRPLLWFSWIEIPCGMKLALIFGKETARRFLLQEAWHSVDIFGFVHYFCLTLGRTIINLSQFVSLSAMFPPDFFFCTRTPTLSRDRMQTHKTKSTCLFIVQILFGLSPPTLPQPLHLDMVSASTATSCQPQTMHSYIWQDKEHNCWRFYRREDALPTLPWCHLKGVQTEIFMAYGFFFSHLPQKDGFGRLRPLWKSIMALSSGLYDLRLR